MSAMRSFSVIPESPDALVSANGTASTPDGKLLFLLPPAGNCGLLVSRTDLPVTIEDFEPCLTLHEGTNADVLARGGDLFIASEQVDGTNRVDRRKGGNLIDQKVTWKEESCLDGITGDSIRLEFRFFGALDSPQLYSFWFHEN